MQLICTIVCFDVTSSSNRDLHYPQWIPPGLSTSSLTNGFHPESIQLHCDPSEVGLVLRHLWHCLASLAAISHPTCSFKPEVPANARAWPIHSSPQLLWLHSFFPPPDQLLRQILFFLTTIPKFLPDKSIHYIHCPPTIEYGDSYSPSLKMHEKLMKLRLLLPAFDRAGQTNGLLWGRRDQTQPSQPFLFFPR